MYPETREQRCWVHTLVPQSPAAAAGRGGRLDQVADGAREKANVLDELPRRLQPRAKAMLQELMRAPDRDSVEEEIENFVEEYGSRYPKTTECLLKDRETLLTLFDFPAEHWLPLRTTNPIEASFATVKARTWKTKGVKLALAADERWRKVNAPHQVAFVRAGVEFRVGEQVLHYYQVEPSVLERAMVEVAA